MDYGVRRINFYRSKAWKTVRKNVWLKQNCLCARCHRPVYVRGISEPIPKEYQVKGIVHHKIHLDNTNVYDDEISLNEDNLEGVCKSCHEMLHHPDISTRSNYTFDEYGNLVLK